MAGMQTVSFRRREHGQAAVEFALMVVFLMLLIVGFFELIMLGYTYNVLADSAKEGVRYAIVHGTDLDAAHCSGPGTTATTPPRTCADATGNNVQNAVTKYAKYSLHDTAAMTITPTYVDGSSAPPNRIRIVVSYPYQAFFGLGWPTVTVRAAAEGRIMF
ncbi:MAG TPA: TadE/TadG family type IV pilus assembly protein [Terriglobales bacterium]|nr:TadE/TadG family type IV pilus assembly protein [Terriglobales bacterium]